MLLNYKVDMLGSAHPLVPTVPMLLYCMYQCMFASITPALISGSMAERARFRTYCLFCALWLTLVYCPVAHSIWHPEGWLFRLGCIDFAGGLVVHLTSGTAALVFSVCLRRRKGYYNIVDVVEAALCRKKPPKREGEPDTMEPVTVGSAVPTMIDRIKNFPSPAGDFKAHSLPLLAIGTGILWVGWFGFNGGSSFVPNQQSVIGMVNTNFAGAISCLTWMILDMCFHKGKSPILGICNGAICGLAAITPGAGYMYPSYAALCGFTSTIISYFFIKVKVWFMDDSLDVVGIHMVQGIYGIIFTGIFASKDIAAHGGIVIAGGWIDGNFVQLGYQLAGIAFTFLWTLVFTVILYYFLDWLPGFGWRVSDHEERIGLDQSQHHEDSYIFEDLEDLEYHGNEKAQEDYKPLSKVLFRDYLVDPILRPPKKLGMTRTNEKKHAVEKLESDKVIPGETKTVVVVTEKDNGENQIAVFQKQTDGTEKNVELQDAPRVEEIHPTQTEPTETQINQ
jgi:Amt family ammonium transporter